MRKPATFSLSLFLIASVFADIAAAETKSSSSIKTGEILSRQYFFEEAKKKMVYTLYLPSYYKKSVKWPLMVALHGLRSDPQQIIRYPGLTKLAEHYGYIIVAPMGYNRKGWYGARVPFGRPSPPNLAQLSEKDVMNVLAITRKELNVDDRRIYLMGHSMGGGGAMHLGIKYPNIWAGLAPIAPAAYGNRDDLKKIKHIPIVMVQGDRDTLVPVKLARAWATKMREFKLDHRYIEVKGGDHVRVAFEYMPQIFEFLDRKQRKAPDNK